jgi:hypothetical protein
LLGKKVSARVIRVFPLHVKRQQGPPLVSCGKLKGNHIDLLKFPKKIAICNLLFDLFKTFEMYPVATSKMKR